MKKTFTKKTTSRLAAYSAMAVALTASSEADAQIVYNDIEDGTVTANVEYENFPLDMNEDGLIDFVFRAGIISSTGGSLWTFGSVFGMYSALSAGNVNNQVIGTSGGAVPYAYALESGYPIGPDAAFMSNSASSNYGVLASNYYGDPYGYFPGEGEKFVGVRFDVAGAVHYGWIRVSATLEPVSITIIDCAFDATPETAIEAGDMESVSINAFPENTFQIYSIDKSVIINTSIVISDQMKISVFNATGSNVYAENLNQKNTKIDLTTLASGIYTVQILSADGVFSKNVFIN